MATSNIELMALDMLDTLHTHGWEFFNDQNAWVRAILADPEFAAFGPDNLSDEGFQEAWDADPGTTDDEDAYASHWARVDAIRSLGTAIVVYRQRVAKPDPLLVRSAEDIFTDAIRHAFVLVVGAGEQSL